MRPEYPLSSPLPMSQNMVDSNKQMLVQELLKVPGNDTCADCGAALTIEDAWAVLSYGILVCDDCKLVHIEKENHYNAPDVNGVLADASPKGILATQFANVWEDKDFAQIRANGNQRTNNRFLDSSPVWQYRPSANDGIKLKEYWINCKYSGNAGEAAENPKIAAKKSFIGLQFTRPMPKGSYPCCAVLQNETLYLTSDSHNEEIHIEYIETLVVNSKRIGHENGVQLTYRTSAKDANAIAFSYLQHDNMETVMDWINLVLYTKYNLLKRKYPTMTDQNVAKILNCGMVKESYMHVAGRGLIYLSLSEARLSCFQHHLDDKPLFQIAVSEVLNLTAAQYLDALACFFDINASKILSYGDWFNALEQVLKTDKITAMPDDMPKPSFPFSLLKKPETAPPPPVERNEPAPAVQFQEPSVPLPAATVVSPTVVSPVNNPLPAPIKDSEKEGESKPSNHDCYPPIGPMGEMGKVYRGELPPDAIKPPPSKSDMTRSVFGDYIPQIPAQVPLQNIKPGNYGELMNQSLTSYAATLNTTASGLLNQSMTKETMTCYPPIGGPPQARKISYTSMPPINALQAAQLRREQESLSLEDLRSAAAANMLSQGSVYHQSTLAQKPALYEQSLQSRIPNNLAAVGRFTENDPTSVFASGIPQTPFHGWGDAGTENLLTVPWKSTGNGYEPARNYSGTPAQYQEAWNAKMQALAGEQQRKISSQLGKTGGNHFVNWPGRSASLDLTQQQVVLGRNSVGWGSNGSSGAIDHWNGKSPTSPIDTFMSLNARDPRTTPNLFGASSAGRSLPNGKVTSRNDSTPSGMNSQQQIIMENLLRQWKSAEQQLLSLIHNGYVPASDMSPAGLDKDSAEHAFTCITELFELLWKQRYDLALSFLRGFREVFAKSLHPEIKNLFIGVGELDTMKRIFLQQGKEKFHKSSAGGPVTWKQQTSPPAQVDSSWQLSANSMPLRESPTDFSPWGGLFSPTATDSLWGGGSSTAGTTATSRTASISSDPWSNTASMFAASTNNGPSFNRAPSRPVSHAHSNFGDHSPTEGSFGSKTSSNSTSPRVVTPPTSYDPMTSSNSLPHGLENTLKNIFLSSE